MASVDPIQPGKHAAAISTMLLATSAAFVGVRTYFG